MEILNIEATKTLIKRYKTITLKEITAEFKINSRPAKKLTGFGDSDTCTLCLAIPFDRPTACFKCIHCLIDRGNGWMCLEGRHHDIQYAKSPKELRDAYRERAKYLQSLLDKYNSNEAS